MKAKPVLKNSTSREAEKKVTLCPQSDALLQTLKALSRRKDLWVQDQEVSECCLCSQRFSALRRRHHCRICGKIFCKKCSLGLVELQSGTLRCCDCCISYLQVTPETDTLQFLKNKLDQHPKPVQDNGHSESDDSDSAELPDVDDTNSSEEREAGSSPDEPFKPCLKELNGQCFINVIEAKNLSITQECTGVYCLISLGRQQVRTVSSKGPQLLTRKAQWREGFFFDVTHADSVVVIAVWGEYMTLQSNNCFLGELSIPVSTLLNQDPIEKEFKLRSKDNELKIATILCRISYTNSKNKVVPEDFVNLKVVGRGNFGKVMQVKKKDTGRIYAMKVLNKQTVIQNDAVQHTLSERNVLRRVNHPFIVSLKYSFQTDKKLYLVLDYLCGGELFTHLSNVDHFSEWRTKFYAAQIVLALGHLHAMDVIYRDLKPENLLLDMDGFVCLTDFGLVKEGVAWDEKTNTYCGSPEYLAPEILLGKSYGKAVDWWALGTFIYEMLSGWPPFFDENHKIMNRKILHEPLVFDPKLFSTQAISILKGLLDRNPDKRLGNGPHGTEDIKSHPFFSDVDWNKLYRREIEPPFKPHLQHLLDTRFFSEEFTLESVKETYVPDIPFGKTFQDAFRGFSWQAPSEMDKVAATAKRRSRRKLVLDLDKAGEFGDESPSSPITLGADVDPRSLSGPLPPSSSTPVKSELKISKESLTPLPGAEKSQYLTVPSGNNYL